jgi:DNA-3-methyladenine glycosylase II
VFAVVRWQAFERFKTRRDIVQPLLTFELKPTAPFSLEFTAWALRRRPVNQVDRWDGSTYRRVIAIHGRPVEISVFQQGTRESPRLVVTVVGEGLHSKRKAEAEIKALLTHMFGLQLDLDAFYEMASRAPKLRELAERYRGLKPVRFPTIFETLANAFACQQFTIAAGVQLLNRLARKGSITFETNAGVVFGFPEPSDLLRLSPRTYRKLGFSRQKTNAFRELSRNLVSQHLDFETLASRKNEDAISFLLGLRGVGRWTAEYVLLRGLGRIDIFPGDDVGAQNRLAKWLHRSRRMNYASVRRALKCWEPYAGFIYFHMLMESLSATGNICTE